MIKKCEVCGNPYETVVNNQRYCSDECATKARRHREHEREENKRRRKRNQDRISEIAAEARRCGMSYGQYKAMLYVKGMR